MDRSDRNAIIDYVVSYIVDKWGDIDIVVQGGSEFQIEFDNYVINVNGYINKIYFMYTQVYKFNTIDDVFTIIDCIFNNIGPPSSDV